MKKTDKVLQTLASLIPESAREKVTAAVSEFLDETVSELKETYEENLLEATESLHQEKEDIKAKALSGYAEAYEIISEQKDQINAQREEMEKHMVEQFEVAHQMIEEEKGKNQNVSSDLYEQYDAKVKDIQEFIIDNLDRFLEEKGDEFYQAAKREVLSDPCMAEHKVTLDRILEVASDYLSDEDKTFNTSGKLDTLSRQVKDLHDQIKVLEGRNVRLHTENTKLNEVARHAQTLVNESKKVETRQRVEKAKKAESHGEKVFGNRTKVITEQQDTVKAAKTNRVLTEAEENNFAAWEKYI